MKKITLSILLMAICMPLFANNNSETTSTIVTSSGISLGTAIAVVASWSKNKSILWAIIHGFLSWFYVIYFALTRKD
jgi:hypothetical protein